MEKRYVPSKQELVTRIKKQGERARKIASQMSAEDWQMGVHEAGWTVKQAYCHLASTAGAAPFIVAMANQAPGESGGGAPFDINEFNKHQVGLRVGKEPAEIVSELQQNIAASVQTLEGLDDSAIEKQMTSPATGQPDSFSNVVNLIMVDHYRGHLDEIAKITGHD